MAHLPTSDAFRRAVSKETWKQFAKSMRLKLLMLAVAIVAIAVVVGLDAMKAQLRDTREKRTKIRDAYAERIGKTDQDIRDAVTADPAAAPNPPRISQRSRT